MPHARRMYLRDEEVQWMLALLFPDRDEFRFFNPLVAVEAKQSLTRKLRERWRTIRAETMPSVAAVFGQAADKQDDDFCAEIEEGKNE